MKKLNLFFRAFVVCALIGFTVTSCENENVDIDENAQLQDEQMHETIVFRGQSFDLTLEKGNIVTSGVDSKLLELWETGFVLSHDDKFYVFETEAEEDAFIDALPPITDLDGTNIEAGDGSSLLNNFEVQLADIEERIFGPGGGVRIGDNATITRDTRRLSGVRSVRNRNRNMNDIVSFALVRNPTNDRYRVTFFENNSFRGRRLARVFRPRFSTSVRQSDFRARGMDNRTSSVRIRVRN